MRANRLLLRLIEPGDNDAIDARLDTLVDEEVRGPLGSAGIELGSELHHRLLESPVAIEGDGALPRADQRGAGASSSRIKLLASGQERNEGAGAAVSAPRRRKAPPGTAAAGRLLTELGVVSTLRGWMSCAAVFLS